MAQSHPEHNQTVACIKDGRKFVAVYHDGDWYNKRGYHELGETARHTEVSSWRPVRFPDPADSSESR